MKTFKAAQVAFSFIPYSHSLPFYIIIRPIKTARVLTGSGGSVPWPLNDFDRLSIESIPVISKQISGE